MRVLNRASGHDNRYLGGWQVPVRPGAPTGGATIDAEARSAIVNLMNALAVAGILPVS